MRLIHQTLSPPVLREPSRQRSQATSTRTLAAVSKIHQMKSNHADVPEDANAKKLIAEAENYVAFWIKLIHGEDPDVEGTNPANWPPEIDDEISRWIGKRVSLLVSYLFPVVDLNLVRTDLDAVR